MIYRGGISRRGGLKVSTLDSGSRCPESVCFVLGKHTLLSQCLSQHRCINAGRQPYDGLASHPGEGGEVEILLVSSCLKPG